MHPSTIDCMKSSTWKRFAVGMAAVWLIVFVATIGASIYREIDGPTVRSVQAENRALRIENKRLTETLQLVSHEFDDTMANLTSMQTDRDFISVKLADAEVRGNGFAEELEQFKTWWPVGWLSVSIR